MLTMKGGKTIKGTWMFDKLNGVACIQEKKNGSKNYFIYKDEMQISLSKDIGWKSYLYVVLSIIAMLAHYILIPFAIIANYYLFIAVGVAFIIYIVMSCYTEISTYM